MNDLDLNSLWSEIHSVHGSASGNAPYVDLERYNNPLETPNGHLLHKNAFFKQLDDSENNLYLLHVTKEIAKVRSSGTLYPSAGCLVGCIYTTQLYRKAKDTFEMHNLGSHILHKEASLTPGESTPIIIEVAYTRKTKKQRTSGVNYLKLGKLHHTIYENLKYLLTPSERRQLESIVGSKISKSLNFIDLCVGINNRTQEVSSADFINLLSQNVRHLPILGYIYFETIAQYTMLYSEDDRSKQLQEKGEFNNEIYKSLLLDIYAQIGKFKLSDFDIPFDNLQRKITDLTDNRTLKIYKDHFYEYVRTQVAHLVVQTFFDNPVDSIAVDCKQLTSDSFSTILSPLKGHMIHRELRNFNRYKDFYFYFDQFKALSAWNYWNKMNISLPFNGPLQKGEIGINPAYPHASYKLFTAKVSDQDANTLIIDEELEGVEIVPRLVDLRHTVMRSRDHETDMLIKGAQPA